MAAIDYSFKVEKRVFLMWKDIGNAASQKVWDKESHWMAYPQLFLDSYGPIAGGNHEVALVCLPEL